MDRFSVTVGRLYKSVGGWMTMADYDQAKKSAIRAIFARFSRGNVLVQQGDYLTEEDAASLVLAGDRALAELDRAALRH